MKRALTGLSSLTATLVAAFAMVPPAIADEGMWTYDNFPSALVRERYGVDIDQRWLDRVRQATIRLANCTASFVSPDGLILTNHHCAASCLAELSSQGNDRLRDGFNARTRGEELRCGTQVADVLMEMEDITAKVAAATAGKSEAEANEARKQTLTQLEQACEKAASTRDPRRCESVRLYQGGQTFLYKYRRYSDVRMVFAPEAAIAAFGGDPDNFQFPRWCLDMALMRAYDANGKPARTPGHLRIDWNGPAANEAVFVSGHPGSTDRLLTLAQLQAQREDLPFWLLRASELRGRYIQFGKTGEENARIVGDPLSSIENSIKVRRRELDALIDPKLNAQKQAAESELRARASFPAGEDPWAAIEKAMQREAELRVPYVFIESGAGFNSALFRYARALVRAAAERAKPSEQRLREFAETALPRLEQQLLAPVPVYPDREKLTLSFGFERMREWLGPDHALVRTLLAEDSPDSLAAELVDGTRLGDPKVREELWKGGAAAIAASRDPMIRIAQLVDEEARRLRKSYEDEVEAAVEVASEKIAALRFATYGTSVYPDATFTLRLNFGTVQGWNEDGRQIEPFTRLARLFERATGRDPFRIPESWLAARDRLDMNTPFNLSSNNDIVGGNSGSPMINARGEVVGLMFDGNIHSISGSYWFDQEKNRSVAVHTAIMKEALTKVYDVGALRKELGL